MKKVISIWLRNFFGFSRTEANGFIILSILMTLILILPIITKNYLLHVQTDLQNENDRNKLTALLSKLENNVTIERSKTPKSTVSSKPFDLNLSDSEELEEAGFPSFLAKRVVKYREKIKPFHRKSELLKIYGIDSGFYKKVYPRMRLTKLSRNQEQEPEQFSETKISPTPKKNKKPVNEAFNINQADTGQLMKIYGIGSIYSERIIKYREYLGGFHSLLQLKEVYGLKQENIDSLEQYIFVDENENLRQLKVNELNADSLVQHPYISYKEANLLINYRNQHGKYNSIKDLLAIKILDSSWVKKVNPYISFD